MGTAGFRKTAATPTTSNRRGSTQAPATARPVTAVRGAGYTSTSRVSSGTSFDPLNQAKTFNSGFQAKDDSSPEAKIKSLEKKVNDLLEESILAAERGDKKLSLDKARDAVSKEKSLTKQKERLPVTEGIAINLDLALAVQFNQALQLCNQEMHTESINCYTTIMKNRSFANSGRLKLNVGNIYFMQENYPKAIKMYRMALDQVANTQKFLRMEIMKNIGLAFVKLNQFTDAITSFEYIMSEKADHRTALHLIVCHYAVNDRESMKKSFTDLLDVHSKKRKAQLESPSSDEETDADAGHQFLAEVIRSDRLRLQENERRQEEEWCILTAAKLISPVITDSISSGFQWTVDCIRNAGCSDLADDLEISKAVKHLKKREFSHAIETLKRFEKKDGRSAATAATNLSFLYLLQNEVSQAEKYADEAIESDRYNVGALVNKGNCLFRKNELHKAQDYYREALNQETTCPEALYNLMISCKKLGQADHALESALKLNYIIKNHPYFLFQMANM
jgi:intraflagellar transport protein 88